MKMNDFVISYSLRQLAQNKDIQNIVLKLNEKKSSKDIVSVYLPLANECICKIAENPNLRDQGFDSCYELSDSKLINELIKIKVLSTTNDYVFTEDDGGAYVADIMISNPSFIEHYYQWIKDECHILNYGIFSLHTFTGEAYCMDNRYKFDTSKGLFRVFKAFLEEPTHVLSYIQIHNIFYEENIIDVSKAKFINQTISEIREKLKMTNKFSKLLIPADKRYLLKSL